MTETTTTTLADRLRLALETPAVDPDEFIIDGDDLREAIALIEPAPPAPEVIPPGPAVAFYDIDFAGQQLIVGADADGRVASVIGINTDTREQQVIDPALFGLVRITTRVAGG